MAEAEAWARFLGMPQGGRPCYLPGVIAQSLPEPRPLRELPELQIDRYCCLGGGEADLMGCSSRFAESIVATHRDDSQNDSPSTKTFWRAAHVAR